ncbi:unknown [Ruminococcus sp. CAG:382]|nr:unknown [Ruminococcus sp. CAG:382]
MNGMETESIFMGRTVRISESRYCAVNRDAVNITVSETAPSSSANAIPVFLNRLAARQALSGLFIPSASPVRRDTLTVSPAVEKVVKSAYTDMTS